MWLPDAINHSKAVALASSPPKLLFPDGEGTVMLLLGG